MFNALFFHAISIIIRIREPKVLSPKAVLTLPHLYCAIQLEITSIQDKFYSNTEFSLPPSALLKKPEWNTHIKYDLLFPSCYKTHTKSCLYLRNQGLQLFREITATYSKGLTAAGLTSNSDTKEPLKLQSQKMCNRHYHRHLKSWTMLLTEPLALLLANRYKQTLSCKPNSTQNLHKLLWSPGHQAAEAQPVCFHSSFASLFSLLFLATHIQ